jgi:hypothetical protein
MQRLCVSVTSQPAGKTARVMRGGGAREVIKIAQAVGAFGERHGKDLCCHLGVNELHVRLEPLRDVVCAAQYNSLHSETNSK